MRRSTRNVHLKIFGKTISFFYIYCIYFLFLNYKHCYKIFMLESQALVRLVSKWIFNDKYRFLTDDVSLTVSNMFLDFM